MSEQAMTLTETHRRIDALNAMLAMLDDGVLAHDLAPRLNCGEIETIAEVCESYELEAAKEWRLQHAITDDCEDHEELRKQWEKTEN